MKTKQQTREMKQARKLKRKGYDVLESLKRPAKEVRS